MHCETCAHNERPGFVLRVAARDSYGNEQFAYRPCPACNGTAIQSCCEGMCGGPDEVTNGRCSNAVVKTELDAR